MNISVLNLFGWDAFKANTGLIGLDHLFDLFMTTWLPYSSTIAAGVCALLAIFFRKIGGYQG